MEIAKNFFGEDRPKNREEIMHCVNQAECMPDEMEAEISYDKWEAPKAGEINMTGFTGEVRNTEDGGSIFTTQGYETKEALMEDLRAAGIDHFNDFSDL